jgi:hypothetical protein
LSAISKLKINLKEISSNQIAGIEKNSGKIYGGRKIKFVRLFPIDISPKSPRILNYSKNSESKIV